ncbi:conjugal transfer protein TraG [Vallicoccus soli]|uniref:Conjugal transfer protein TraG n=2 Tax=Vallicoccus soli TaxID=2339232 RepID=A0A3A3YZE3_9ACTN|nr:conjugal transfer protein TraG [Vallicoccus soli]
MLPPGTGLPFTLLGLAWGGVGLLGLLYGAGATASWLTGHGWHVPPLRAAAVDRLLEGGPATLWPQVPVGLVWSLAAIAVLAVGAPVLVAAARLQRGQRERSLERSLSGGGRLVAMTPHGVAERAPRLRVSLQATPVRRIAPRDAGVPLGRLGRRGPELRASWEDVQLAVMAPRAGKTTSLAVPAVLDAPGAVVATSNKADLWAATAALRAQDTDEPVWVFDPQGIAATPRTWWWNPLRGLDTVEEASRLAGHFIQEVRGDKNGRDFWTSAAHDLLTGLLLAAAAGRRPLDEVYEWLNDPVIPTPAMLLREAGHPAAAASLAGRQNGAPETRDGIYETARTAAQCLRDPRIMAWVSPDQAARVRLDEFDTARFASSRQTLYLLSKDGAGAAAPLVAALTDRVMRDAVRVAERRGGRLDPPMVVVLDEAANVCRISDLPDLYSHLGSRGVVPLTILQSYRQGVRIWGEPGMDALWSAATVKLIGAGIDDAKLAEDLSRLVGEHDVSVRSYSYGSRQRSDTTSLRRERILPADKVRALPRGTALLLATGNPPALLRLTPHYASTRADAVATAVRAADGLLAERMSQLPNNRQEP